MNLKKLIILFIIIFSTSYIAFYFSNSKNVGINNMPASTSNNILSISPTPVHEAKKLKITAVGDILLGRGVESRLNAKKKDFIYPFQKIEKLLKQGDIIFGNLEEPITSSTHSLTSISKKGKYVLKNSIESFKGIQFAGFNLLNLANNHILDYYEKGLLDTIDILDKNKISYAGAGKDLSDARKPALVEKNGLKIGMLSYTDMAYVLYKGKPSLKFAATNSKSGVVPREFQYIKEDIEKLRPKVDLVIVSLHWGVEESFNIPKEQRDFAYKVIDLGADMILGHHPHQFQGVEIYNEKPIIYSMGNFIFDQNDSENQESFILNMEYENKYLKSFYMIPIKTLEKTQVVPLYGDDAVSLLNRELKLCKSLGTNCSIKDDKIVFK